MRRVLVAATMLLMALAPAEAQRPGGPPQDRAVLERRVRQAMSRMIRERVGLNDGQMATLMQVNRRFEGERRELLRRERTTRQALRASLMKGDSADESAIERQLADLGQVQRRRLEITENEQRELAKFMTPLQRARYLAIQEQVRRRLDDMRGARPGNRLLEDSAPMPRGGGRRAP